MILRGRRSRNKVSVGEPAEGSFRAVVLAYPVVLTVNHNFPFLISIRYSATMIIVAVDSTKHIVLSIHVLQVVVSMKDDVHIAMYSDLRGIAICQMLNVEGTVLTSFVQARATGDLTS